MDVTLLMCYCVAHGSLGFCFFRSKYSMKRQIESIAMRLGVGMQERR